MTHRPHALTSRLVLHSSIVLSTMLLAVALRIYPIVAYDYPTGTDYGQIMFQAELTLEQGGLPSTVPYFQLGQTEWLVMPGPALLFAALLAFTQAEALRLMLLFAGLSVIEISSAYVLARQVFYRLDAIALFLLIIAVSPGRVDMTAWSGFANLIALSVLPAAFAAFLAYWQQPSGRRMVLAAVMICGTVLLHHVAILWVIVPLILFCVYSLIRTPRSALRKLWPLVVLGLGLGLPIVIYLVNTYLLGGAAGVLVDSETRFTETRVSWWFWATFLGDGLLLLVTGGFVLFLRQRDVSPAGKIMITAYAATTLLFTFGWLVGIQFHYTRASFFTTIPAAAGIVGLSHIWSNRHVRTIVVAALTLTLGLQATLRGSYGAEFFEVMSDDVLTGMTWVRDNSELDDVVVMGTFLGFHSPRLLERPMMQALSPDLVGNPAELTIAADATQIMRGAPDMLALAQANNVRYIIVRQLPYSDIPSPQLAHSTFPDIAAIENVFENDSLVVYEVLR